MAIILIVVLLIGGAIGGLIFLQQWKRQRQNEHLRLTGIQAYEQGEHALAVDNLRRYLSRVGDDADALYAYSKASLKTPQPGNRHIGQALGALSQVLKIDPNYPDAAHDLLLLRTLVRQNDEALELAETLLQADPQDTKALGSKAVVLMRLERPQEALAVAEQALKIDPDLYQMNLIRIQLRHQLGQPVDELLAGAKALQEAHPEDPRYEMLLGYTYALANDDEQAKHWLHSAAQRDLNEEQFATTLLGVLDTAQMYQESLGLLLRAGANAQWATLRTEMAQRLLEAQEFEEVVQRLGELDPATAEVTDLAMKAMALYHLDRREEAEAIRLALAAREESPQAPVWASVLGEVYAEQPQALQTIEACRKALETAPNNGYFHAFMGNAYASIGDNELAMESWRKAANYRPSWSGIRGQIARAMLSRKNTEEAVSFAREAYIRQPNRVGNIVTLVRARAMEIKDYNSPEAKETLRLIEQVQQNAPGEPQTRVLQVSMLAEMGRRDEAAAALLSILDDDRELDQAYWLLLAEISRKHELGLEDRLLARVQKQEGNTAELALTRATELARDGKPDEGLALIEAGLKTATPENQNQWQLVWAMFLDILDDPRAHDAWAELVEDQPENIRALQLALHAKSLSADRALTERILDRLRELMGEDSIVWRIARARFLIDSTDVARDSARAITLLRGVIDDSPKRIEPRLMLAQALEQLNRETQAIGELRAADQAIPNSTAVQLELARLHQKVRQFSGARNYLDIVTSNPGASAEDLRTASALLVRQGEDDQAIQLLERLQSNPDTANDAQRLTLATLYHRNGQPDRARTLLEEALRRPTAATLAFALEFYQGRNQAADVQRILKMLEGDAISDASRDEIIAAYYARAGNIDKAAELYRSQVEESPDNAKAWGQLVAISLATGKLDEALQTADQGLQHVPDDAALRRVRDQAQTLRQVIELDWVRPLLITLVTDASHGEVAAQALRLIAQAAEAASDSGNQAMQQLAQQLRAIADQEQDVLSLQMASARVHMRAGQPQEAATVASRAARAFPRAAEPTWLHAEALANAGQWLDALGAATEWRSRSAGSTEMPDTMIAEAHLQLGDPARAMQTLQPHVQAALAAPAQHAPVVSRYIRALVAQRRYDEAGTILLPLTAQDAAWRKLAMEQASGHIDAAPVVSAWLARVAEHVPADVVNEQLALARSYWTASQRLGDESLAGQARQMVDQITRKADAPATAWYIRGLMAEAAGDLAAAEGSYRAALERNENLAVVQNNLAMVLVNRGASGSQLSEAQRLAEAAVSAAPSNVYFLDTLAAVQAKAGNVDAAVATLNRAIQLDPDNDTWKRNLVKILQDSGREEEAKKILDQLQRQAGV